MSREKGNRAEREVAALLQAWWSQHEPGALFVRTPLSGGWGGPELRGAFRAAADVMTTSRSFPFSVEVKRRERWSWERLAAGRSSPVWEWWLDAQRQAEELDATPMLWLRQNRGRWRIMVPRRWFDDLGFQVRSRVPKQAAWEEAELRGLGVGILPVVVDAELLLAWLSPITAMICSPSRPSPPPTAARSRRTSRA